MLVLDEQQIGTLCALNPDDPATPSALTIASAIARDPSSIANVLAWIKAKLTYLQFTQVCVCNGSASVHPPPCTSIASGNVAVGTNVTLGTCSFPGTCAYPSAGPWTIPTNQHHLRLQISNIVQGGGTNQVALYTSPSGTHHDVTLSGSTPTSVDFDYPTADTSVDFYYRGSVSFTGFDYIIDSWNASGETPCTGSPTTPPALTVPTQPTTLTLPALPACSTTADLCTQLERLTQKVDWLMRTTPTTLTVTSIAEGTVHAGLTGTGTLTVSGIRGVRVLLTTIPSYLGNVSGTPPLELRAGRIRFHSPEGWSPTIWHLHTTPLEIIGIDPLVDQIGYTLSPQVVASIIELVRGP